VASIIHALVLMAVAVIIHAIWQMGKVLCPDWSRRLLMAIACIFTLVVSGVLSQFLLIVGAGLLFAGISGFCGMAKVLVNMPWNKR
jgi:chromate transport protein ChrA